MFALVSEDNVRISVTVPKELHNLLLKDADYEDRSVSNLVLKIIKEHYRLKTDE